ncbi:MAG: ATP-dependent helicase HrpB [Bacteroidetes bacterium]|jgi:ATP-dependent helicase HrpB|nr:ATP-dependent helicase HrpB [Bacteroidota bacterium]
MSPLPVDAVLPSLAEALSRNSSAVLVADPGAGKTTRVPLALLQASWLQGRKIIMLEPRRLAARRAAEYMARQLNEPVGRTVGYRIRGDVKIGRDTKVEIVTEGILSRVLVADQDLPGVGLVIFDEFHERSIHADLGLALTLDLQTHLRPDLKILVMSATLDAAAVSGILGQAPVITSKGRVFPVDTIYASQRSDAYLEHRVVDTVRRALSAHEGDVLVFLPGIREIRRTDEALTDKRLPDDVRVHQLYGDAGLRHQLEALAPAPEGVRKVILSTSIAETSLTIDGVRVVVDGGLARTVRFEPRRGMTGLVTVPVSKATADQRRGRAGRQAPGVCYRLWTEGDHVSLPDYPTPEIKATDLAHLALDLARWGDPSGASLRFLDPPPAANLQQARSLLTSLGAVDDRGSLTPHGRAMDELPIHPRLAHMIVRGKERGLGATACTLAAMLEERDALAGRSDADIGLDARWQAVMRGKAERGLRERIDEQADRLREIVGISETSASDRHLSLLLGLAYPDRVGRRKGESGNYQLMGGAVATIPKSSAFSKHEFLAFGDVDGAGATVRAYLAAPLERDEVEAVFEGQWIDEQDIRWNATSSSVTARNIQRAGSLVLDERPMEARGERVTEAMLDGIRSLGLSVLPWDRSSRGIVERSEWLRRGRYVSEDWPDLSDERLLDELHDWLAPFMDGIWKKEHLSRLDLAEILRGRYTHRQLVELDRLAPTHILVPSGSRIALDYRPGETPVVAVKLQEMFGETRTPSIAGGKVNLVVHLLSPAKRPLAVTQDLPSFWKNTYPKLRNQMRADYPKHPWPEDPLTAIPTKKTVRKR